MKTLKRIFARAVEHVDPELLSQALRRAQRVPLIRRRIEREYERMLSGIEGEVKPYRSEFKTFQALPEAAIPREQVLADLQAMSDRERAKWQEGRVSGAVYHGDERHVQFLNQVYALSSQSNPLHADVWPSVVKFEAEIVSMVARMLGGKSSPDGHGVDLCGVVTSGGTESIMLAVKAYRDFAARERGITLPELVTADSAHTAFEKAARTLGVKRVSVPVGSDYRADVTGMANAITKNTIGLVGSAPSFPHGAIDPIAALGQVAQDHKLPLHVDACLGGFVLPWARQLGYAVPEFDFSVPQVASLSVDTHKYGYAAKGTSVILYRDRELLHDQYFTATDWPGGLYFSPTFAGSRPGGLSAACWAAMLSIGKEGYLEATRQILETARYLREGIQAIEGLQILGDPLWVLAFAAPALNIYQIMQEMSDSGWGLNGLHKPACVHLCVTLRHTQPGVAERFLRDLRQAVLRVEAQPSLQTGLAPIYGLAASLPIRGAVSDILKRYLDLLYRP